MTVLVVEDEWFVRLSIAEYLESHDCEVIEARNGEAAAELLRNVDGFDVVFTDIRLSGKLSGWDIGDLSREVHPEIPVVYTSGAVIQPERPVPGSVFLPKPYEPTAVLDTCRRLCRGRLRRHGEAE